MRRRRSVQVLARAALSANSASSRSRRVRATGRSTSLSGTTLKRSGNGFRGAAGRWAVRPLPDGADGRGRHGHSAGEPAHSKGRLRRGMGCGGAARPRAGQVRCDRLVQRRRRGHLPVAGCRRRPTTLGSAARRSISGDSPRRGGVRGVDRSRVSGGGAARRATARTSRPGWCEGVRATLRWAWRHQGPPPLPLPVVASQT
jgi:hypothetical protein